MLVRNFFTKRIQDRIINELNFEKKRMDALGRLFHNYKDVLIHNYMIEISEPNSDYIKIIKLLKSYGANDHCYALPFINEIDGQ